MSRTRGEVFLKGSVAVSDPNDSSLTGQVNVDLPAVRYPQVGALWEIDRRIAVGLCYRHSFSLELDQAFRIDGNIGNPGMPPVVSGGYFAARAVSRDLFQPWQLQAGVTARVVRGVVVSFDLAYVRWAEFPVPASRLDLYNLFNANTATAFQQTFDPLTNGATWLRPTQILNPRFVRFNVTVDF
jgi:long-subunit fatty acid transport protein